MGQTLNFNPGQWGIFDLQGTPAFDFDSFVEMDFDGASKVSSFPVEDGSFANYNKVTNPDRVKVRLAVGGDQNRINALIDDLDIEARAFNLLFVVTPNRIYSDMNLESVQYHRRNRNGENMVIAETTWIEIRQVSATFSDVALPSSNVKGAGSSSKQNNGNQQPGPPPTPLRDLTDDQLRAKGIEIGHRFSGVIGG